MVSPKARWIIKFLSLKVQSSEGMDRAALFRFPGKALCWSETLSFFMKWNPDIGPGLIPTSKPIPHSKSLQNFSQLSHESTSRPSYISSFIKWTIGIERTLGYPQSERFINVLCLVYHTYGILQYPYGNIYIHIYSFQSYSGITQIYKPGGG